MLRARRSAGRGDRDPRGAVLASVPAATRWRRRSTSTRSSRSPTTCSTTSTAPPWPTPSKYASPSSTTTSSNGQPPSRQPSSSADGRTKHILKEAARRLLPPEFVDKPKIGFFNRSLDAGSSTRRRHSWTCTSWTPAKVRDIVDLDIVRRFAHGGPGERRVAFRVLMLELWLEQNTGVSQPYAGAALGGTS